MTTEMKSVVRLAKGSDRVSYEISKGAATVLCENSRGEYDTMPLSVARKRIAKLISAGWQVKTA